MKGTKRFLSFLLVALVSISMTPGDIVYAGNDVQVVSAVKSAKKTASMPVSTQDELNAALKDKSIKKIIISTKKKARFKISKGNYKKKTLIVNAPKADVVNKGSFKSISIKAIKKNTWTEQAEDNTFYVSASVGHIVVPKDSGIKKVVFTGNKSNIRLDIKGDIESIVVDSKTTLNINVTGSVSKIQINNKATVDAGSFHEILSIHVALS